MRRPGLIDLRPLRSSAPFRRLWLSGLLQIVAAQTVIVAVLVQVWELTASTVWTGSIGLVNAVPMIIFGIVGGSLADAMDRRLLVQLTTVGQALAGLGLAWQAMTGLESLPIVLALVGAQATANALGAPARRTFVPRLLPSSQIGGGLALHHLSVQAAMLAGPALGGLIIGVWGTTGCYIGYAGATVLAMYGIIRLPRMPPDRRDRSSRCQVDRRWRPVRSGQTRASGIFRVRSGRHPDGDAGRPVSAGERSPLRR